MADKKTKGETLKEKLFYEKKHIAKLLTDEQAKQAEKFSKEYREFLNKAKTERETIEYTVSSLKKAGFSEFVYGQRYAAGDKVYYINKGKSLIAAVYGNESPDSGLSILAAHIDSPRIDLKQVPLYESSELAYFKTHYYGGIKKYQWPTIPLALHGVFAKKDGTKVTVSIGEEPNDPVFVITDLLPHLADEQMKRPAGKIIAGEELNLLIGSLPFKDDKASELVKLNILSLLNDKYGIDEADFLSAELEAVPAFAAKEVGFDRSLIGGYGQDDRVCAFTALKAALDIKETPDKTLLVVLADKEEIGSTGNTGLDSSFLKYFVADLCEPYGVAARHALTNSLCLSADVNAGFDPTFPDVLEKNNASFVNYGVVATKFTGRGGKYGTSDASAETVASVRKIFDDNKIVWQTGELGKVDLGGGGTVALYIAGLGADVIDIGVPVLSMHSPYELTSKYDVYMTYLAFKAFVKR
ncbi:MAG: aminopeptidase [Oscillospiraceae bacterium]|jgi:aspartyl aminopeptidase|nr:aminopeptidase [Oscillospiraceae bacterium]